MKCYSVLA